MTVYQTRYFVKVEIARHSDDWKLFAGALCSARFSRKEEKREGLSMLSVRVFVSLTSDKFFPAKFN